MENKMIDAIVELQKEKFNILQQMEQGSIEMEQQDVLDLDVMLETQEASMQDIDALQAKINDIAEAMGYLEVMQSVCKNEKNRDDYAVMWHPVFDQAQQNLGILYRLQQQLSQLHTRAILAQSEIKTQIKAQQNIPVIQQYLKTGVSDIQGSALSRSSKKA
ncbi:MAG: hypothetical protein ACRCZJ_02065 [Erysipelotrichaceae bacterium]